MTCLYAFISSRKMCTGRNASWRSNFRTASAPDLRYLAPLSMPRCAGARMPPLPASRSHSPLMRMSLLNSAFSGQAGLHCYILPFSQCLHYEGIFRISALLLSCISCLHLFLRAVYFGLSLLENCRGFVFFSTHHFTCVMLSVFCWAAAYFLWTWRYSPVQPVNALVFTCHMCL